VANADFDQDGQVDGNDFLLWQRGGTPDPFNPADLATWEANYGRSQWMPHGQFLNPPQHC